jgi:hypothetical protein
VAQGISQLHHNATEEDQEAAAQVITAIKGIVYIIDAVCQVPSEASILAVNATLYSSQHFI